MDVSEDPSAIMRRIEARNLREQNLSSLPSIPLDGTYDSASDETSSDEEDEGGTDRWQTAQRQSLGGGQYDGRGNRLLERVEPNVSKSSPSLINSDAPTPMPARYAQEDPIAAAANHSHMSPSGVGFARDPFPSLPSISLPENDDTHDRSTDSHNKNAAAAAAGADSSSSASASGGDVMSMSSATPDPNGSLGSDIQVPLSSTPLHPRQPGLFGKAVSQRRALAEKAKRESEAAATGGVSQSTPTETYVTAEDENDDPATARIGMGRRDVGGGGAGGLRQSTSQSSIRTAIRVEASRRQSRAEGGIEADTSLGDDSHDAEDERKQEQDASSADFMVPLRGEASSPPLQQQHHQLLQETPPPRGWVDNRRRRTNQGVGQGHGQMISAAAAPKSPHPRALLQGSMTYDDEDDEDDDVDISQDGQRRNDAAAPPQSHTPISTPRIPSLTRSATDVSAEAGDDDDERDDQYSSDAAVTKTPEIDSRADDSVRMRFRSMSEEPLALVDEEEAEQVAAERSMAKTPGGVSRYSQLSLSTPGLGRHNSQASSPLYDPLGRDADALVGRTTVFDPHSSIQMHQPSIAIHGLETPRAGAGEDLQKSQMKSFVYSALNSSRRPTRIYGRKTQQRMSTGSAASSDGGPLGLSPPPGHMTPAPHSERGHSPAFSMTSHLLDDLGAGAGGGAQNESFVSVSSSADLTTDRRTTSTRFKGNVSVPGVLPSDIGASESHVDVNKMVKYLKSMNDGLVKENKELHSRLLALETQQQQQQQQSSAAAMVDEESVVSQVAELEEMVKSFEVKASAKDQQIRDLEAAVDEHRQVEDELHDEVERLNQQIETNAAEYARTAQEHAADFQSICQEKDAEAARAAEENNALVKQLEWKMSALEQEKERLREVLDSGSDDAKEKALHAQVEQLTIEVSELQQAALSAQSEIEALKSSKANLEQEIERLSGDLSAADDELDKAAEQVKVLGARAQQAQEGHEQELAAVQSQISGLTRERENAQINLQQAHKESAKLSSNLESAQQQVQSLSVKIEQLQNLQNRPRSVSPGKSQAIEELADLKRQRETEQAAHRAQVDALDRKIQTLSAEKEELVKRVAATPSQTPVAIRTLNHLRTPKTPGPLPNASWMFSSPGDASMTSEAALRRLAIVQAELDAANARLDANFQRLEAAGLTSCHVAQDLASALDKAAHLEAELVASRAARNRAASKLEHTKCPDCDLRFDASDALKTPQAGSSETSSFRRPANGRSNLRETISNLQSQYKTLQEQAEIDQRRKADVINQLQHELQEVNDALEATHATLRDRSVGADETEQLKMEQSQLRRECDQLRQQLRNAETRMRELQTQPLPARAPSPRMQREHETLRQDFEQKKLELEDAERRLSQRDRDLRRVKDDFARLEAKTQRDLAVANRLEKEDARLRAELSRLQSAKTGAESQLASVESQLGGLKQVIERMQVETGTASEVAMQAAIDGLLSERKKLSAQIKYLQSKFARENAFRNALQVQKDYLLCIVGRFKQSERNTLSLIASMGFPSHEQADRAKPSLRAAAIAVLMTVRIKRLSMQWQGVVQKRDAAVAR